MSLIHTNILKKNLFEAFLLSDFVKVGWKKL